MRLTIDQLIKHGYRKNTDGSWGRPSPAVPQALAAAILGTEPQHHVAPPLRSTGQAQAGVGPRVTVCITSRRTRLLDTDNNVASGKYLLDQLRYHGVIPEDDPQTLELITRQEKVKTVEETGTLLEVVFHDKDLIPKPNPNQPTTNNQL